MVETSLSQLGDNLHLGAGRLNGGHIRIQALDSVNDLAKLGVAQVRVNLGVWAHAGGGQAEGTHRPVQVVGVALSVQGQQLTQSRLIHLDGGNAGSFQVANLVAQRQTNLVSNFAQRQVITRERPGNDGHRAGEHTLNRLVG